MEGSWRQLYCSGAAEEQSCCNGARATRSSVEAPGGRHAERACYNRRALPRGADWSRRFAGGATFGVGELLFDRGEINLKFRIGQQRFRQRFTKHAAGVDVARMMLTGNHAVPTDLAAAQRSASR